MVEFVFLPLLSWYMNKTNYVRQSGVKDQHVATEFVTIVAGIEAGQ